MRRQVKPYMRRRPVDADDLALVEEFIRARFPRWVPSPIEEILWVKRLGPHFGARVILFDRVPCLLIVGNGGSHPDEDRWTYRGLPSSFDTRPFFYHRMRAAWTRSDGSKAEALERHRGNLV
ncbi:hypothetical protein MOTC310_17745 [Methylobacterium oryzae]|uniref:Uncharacterized protein n=2 Tax=Methylobacterium oryzae TaxID=334852 RepID=A0ABU7TQW3_9HYPH